MKSLLVIILCLSFSTAAAEPILLSQQQSPDQGVLVRLPDGRLVPYHPDPARRVICADNCVEVEALQRSTPRRRIAVLTVLGAAALWLSVLRFRSDDVSRIPRGLPPAVSLEPSPVPEPATLILLGTGLAVLFRKRK